MRRSLGQLRFRCARRCGIRRRCYEVMVSQEAFVTALRETNPELAAAFVNHRQPSGSVSNSPTEYKGVDNLTTERIAGSELLPVCRRLGSQIQTIPLHC